METRQLPVIAGVTIYTDAEGRFNLNALHQASGGNPNNAPGQWLRLKSTEELKNELIDSTNCADLHSLPIAKKEGCQGGTFADKLLAISYAGWISPSFHLKVNRVFADYQSGKLQSVAPEESDSHLMARALKVADRQISEKNRLIHQQQQQIQQDQPKVAFYEQMVATDQEVSVQEAAKMLGTGEKRLFYFLREYGYLINHGKKWNQPYQRYIDQGFFTLRPGIFKHSTKGDTGYVKTFITGKGLVRIAKHRREIEIREQMARRQERIA
ncbi:phage antirepressor KilAC domain-containing protein [Candidatus Sororendozoicomonas aggregata]|uniref:phage antirepressor KilAC domain-containing protein n=1 Tax=Candidatus Sororendozoicomonas aggregata TaxID=3073239 RepID=UPI002ED157C2